MKKMKYVLLISIFLAIIIMSIGYASFATNLSIQGTSQITGQWDIRITDVTVQEASPGSDPGAPTFTNTSVSFDAKLAKPGDSISYLVTIQNNGSIDAELGGIVFIEEIEGSDAISYTLTKPDDELKSGQTTTFTITVTYKLSTTEMPEVKTKSITGTIEYVQE